MPQSLAQVWLHLVFSTKNRQPWLADPAFREEMFKMLGYHVAQTGCVPELTGGWIDHVHLVLRLSRTISISDLVQELKTETTPWAKKAHNGSSEFSWQAGYAVFSVSQSQVEIVREYVLNQEEHHRRRSFQEELRLRHEIEIDERYVWD